MKRTDNSLVKSRRPAVVRSPREERTARASVFEKWRTSHSYWMLTGLTLFCLAPFLGKAFQADDPLFVWAAQHIVDHPLNPYGFDVVWYTTSMPMAEVTKNPPLACYYSAAVGAVAGWSEITLHLAFLFPSLIVILGTYYLAQRFTRFPLVAAAAALLTPAFLVSSTSLMCDTMMLALWILAACFWLAGLHPTRPRWLIISALLIAASALTKYFGVALIPLLLVYSVAKQRRLGNWVWYLLIPILLLGAYQFWTYNLYGRGLLADAVQYAYVRNTHQMSWLANTMIGFAFVGGCALTGLMFAPVVWPRRWLFIGASLAGLLALCCAIGWIYLPANPAAHEHWIRLSIEFALYVAGGLSILAMALVDWWKRRTPESLLLSLWVLGTFVFAVFLNWTINARSLLPLIPATGILIARRLDELPISFNRSFIWKVATPLVVAGAISIWLAAADTEAANAARSAASLIRQENQTQHGRVIFQGHWGFQYYMQSLGFDPLDVTKYQPEPMDLMAIPMNNANTLEPAPQFIVSRKMLEFAMHRAVTPMRRELGAGFYSSLWGPLPFAFGYVPPERYLLLRLAPPAGESQ